MEYFKLLPGTDRRGAGAVFRGAGCPGGAKKPGVSSVHSKNIRGFQTCTFNRSMAGAENRAYRNCRGLEEFQIELRAELRLYGNNDHRKQTNRR